MQDSHVVVHGGENGEGACRFVHGVRRETMADRRGDLCGVVRRRRVSLCSWGAQLYPISYRHCVIPRTSDHDTHLHHGRLGQVTGVLCASFGFQQPRVKPLFLQLLTCHDNPPKDLGQCGRYTIAVSYSMKLPRGALGTAAYLQRVAAGVCLVYESGPRPGVATRGALGSSTCTWKCKMFSNPKPRMHTHPRSLCWLMSLRDDTLTE